MVTESLQQQVALRWNETFKKTNGDEPGISGLLAYSEAWQIAVDFLYPYDIREPVMKRDLKGVMSAFDVINKKHRLPTLLENFLEDVRKNFRFVEEEVKQAMARYEEEESPDIVGALIARLMEWYNAWLPPHELKLVGTLYSAYTLNFQTRLFSALPPSFSLAFKTLCVALLEPKCEEGDPSKTWDPSAHSAAWINFDQLGLIERFESVIASVGYEFIEKHVMETCAGSWKDPVIENLRNWMSERMVPWMLHVYARGAATSDEAKNMLQGVGSRFDFHLNKSLCDLRTREIFEIIVDYPESTGALHDLRECLQRVDQRSHLVAALRKANRMRLLHPGADTKMILAQYVATIKSLRVIDPPGVLLFKVAEPIRRYLRDRPDTIRSIVANLVGGDDNDDALVDENEPIVPLQQYELEDYSDPNWDPEPLDAGPEFRTNKPSDIISTLVSIYDSRDLFVKELQVLLAQRLLSVKDDIDRVEKERRNVEILKIRFGEAALQVCEVMLKDMTDSKRIDTHVQSQKSSVVHPMIISRHFWPTLESSDLIMPGQFKALHEDYAKQFVVFKPDKRLKWIPHLGSVHLDVELEDRTVSADVWPLEAALIELFSQKPTWALEDLIKEVGSVTRSTAVKALNTWIDLGVLKEDPENTFVLLEKAEEPTEGGGTGRAPMMVDEPEEEVPMNTVQQQQAEQMRVYWKFIEGMLTNLGTLPLDRIQTMLKFAPGYDQTVEQLASFMEAARREGLVAVKDGFWKLTQ